MSRASSTRRGSGRRARSGSLTGPRGAAVGASPVRLLTAPTRAVARVVAGSEARSALQAVHVLVLPARHLRRGDPHSARPRARRALPSPAGRQSDQAPAAFARHGLTHCARRRPGAPVGGGQLRNVSCTCNAREAGESRTCDGDAAHPHVREAGDLHGDGRLVRRHARAASDAHNVSHSCNAPIFHRPRRGSGVERASEPTVSPGAATKRDTMRHFGRSGDRLHRA